jgi:hypothetical protein
MLLVCFLPLASSVLPDSSSRIGNVLTSAPNGIAFADADRSAFVLDPGGAYVASTAAPDNSYHRTLLRLAGGEVTFEWSLEGKEILGRLSSPTPCAVRFDLTANWPGLKSTFDPQPDGVVGHSGGRTLRVWTLPSPSSATAEAFEVAVGPGRPAYLRAGWDTVAAPSAAAIDRRLTREARNYQAHRPATEGEFGDFLGAISDNLNNSRVYSTDNRTVAHTVSRGWAHDPNSAPYFCWDSFFNGLLACLDDPVTARDTVRAILAAQTTEGLVPNFAHWRLEEGAASLDRSQPPVGALCVWKMHQHWPDLGFLKEVYPKLLRWHRWWPTARDGRHDGLLEWGSAKHGMQEALWETGWDDTVQFDGAKMAGATMDAYAVDLNALWAMDAEYLARIADVLRDNRVVAELRAEKMRTLRLMNEKLWNPELGIYCSRLWDGRFLTRLTPMNLYPLIAGAASPEQAESCLRVMLDPKKFWGEWVIPTVSRDDPAFPEQNYWRGKVWGPTNYLLFQGLQRYARAETRNEFAQKSVGLFMRNWTKGLCGENYLSTTGEQSSDPHYTWGALLCRIALENVCDFAEDGSVSLNGTMPTHLELRNVSLHGKPYDIHVEPGLTELRRNGRVVASARGVVVRHRLR